MARNIMEAAQRVALASQEEIETLARHDPDMFRDIAQRMICFHAGIDVWIVGNGRISYPSRVAVKNLANKLKAELVAAN